MRQLIVNADDLGADDARNDGIFEAIEAGSVTSVSILPNAPALEDALARLRALKGPEISVGVHLNLSEGRPVSEGLNLLTGSEGSFPGKAVAQRLLSRRDNPLLELEIRRELSAQIQRLHNAGICVDHIDGHQHIHILPAVVRPAAEAAALHGIRWVRIPEETSPAFGNAAVTAESVGEARFFSDHAAAARPLFEAMGLRAPDQFRGLYLKGRLDPALWREFQELLPPGLTEFMVHPGRVTGRSAGPFSGFSTGDREKELEALLDERFLAALREGNVHLVPYPNV